LRDKWAHAKHILQLLPVTVYSYLLFRSNKFRVHTRGRYSIHETLLQVKLTAVYNAKISWMPEWFSYILYTANHSFNGSWACLIVSLRNTYAGGKPRVGNISYDDTFFSRSSFLWYGLGIRVTSIFWCMSQQIDPSVIKAQVSDNHY